MELSFCKTEDGRILEAFSLMELVDGAWVPAKDILLGDVMDARTLPADEISKLPKFKDDNSADRDRR